MSWIQHFALFGESAGGFLGWVGRMLGIENLKSFERFPELTLAAPWAQYRGAPAWIFFACVLLVVGSVIFYTHYQTRGPRRVRLLLSGLRAASLVLVLLILFEPTLVAHYVSNPRPQLWVVFDGSESMQLRDEFPADERAKLAQAVGLSAGTSDDKFARLDYIKALVGKKDKNLLTALSEKFRLRAFVFDRPDGVRAVELSDAPDGPIQPAKAVEQLTAEGQVTAIGSALSDLGRRHSAGHLAGVLVFSDFDQNAGPPPLAAAEKLGVPVYTVGVGPIEAVDLEVSLQSPLSMKKEEESTVVAILRPRGLNGKSVNVKVFARKAVEGKSGEGPTTPIGERVVTLGSDSLPVDFLFKPVESGRFTLVAEVEKAEGENVVQNNHAEREVMIRDEFMRLLFVEYEPTWEWRFIKEVFHRDPMVGMRGFRTFLRSADPKVRQSNELFLPTLTPKRSDFFANDVIFLGDMPAATLSTRFCEMTREFVEKFGGGLVVMAGPRFGPGQLAQTPLGDMLPVEVDLDARVRDERERDVEGDRGFPMRRTLEAEQFDFMRLGFDTVENEKGWNNLSRIPWYQPVARPRNGATVLAEVPIHTCIDGVTPQPIIAIRRLGKGEVIYIGFDETWRLRRKYGEMYYRKFWGQMIHRLGMSHALGSQKRFVVETDRQHYQSDDKVLLTVDAYDANFEPLDAEKLPDRKLSAEMIVPGQGDGASGEVQKISVSQLRKGVFEARVPVLKRGEHRIRVADPITSEYSEVVFQVTSRSAEGASAVRKVALEQQIAQTTGGKNYDLTTVHQFVDEVKLPQTNETLVQNIPLWNTYLCFFLVVLLLLSEWLFRKVIHLP